MEVASFTFSIYVSDENSSRYQTSIPTKQPVSSKRCQNINSTHQFSVDASTSDKSVAEVVHEFNKFLHMMEYLQPGQKVVISNV